MTPCIATMSDLTQVNGVKDNAERQKEEREYTANVVNGHLGDGSVGTGLNGNHAVNGINGVNVVNGANGIKGVNGVNGINGINGINGVNGTNGINGDYAHIIPEGKRKRVVVVGLGMVGISFIEKLLKLDAKRHEYSIIVIGEEPYLAYNRVGLTSFFQHRKVESLYLNTESWYSNYSSSDLSYHLNTTVTSISPDSKTVTTSTSQSVPYDILVLATGSDAVLPRHTPGYDAKGVFVYRTIDDLQRLISYSATVKNSTGVVVGGGLLGLEAAKAMMDLEEFASVKLIERNRWVLSRQLDADAGGLVVEQVRNLGLDVRLSKRVGRIDVDENNQVKGVTFEDGDNLECRCICFAIGIKARDSLAREANIKCADRNGGIVIGPDLRTSVPDIYAIGECASWEGQTFGLIAPGIEMADVLAFNLTQAKAHKPRVFQRPDLSTKLKLLGVEVASFGDFFADRDGPQNLPKRRGTGAVASPAKTNGAVQLPAPPAVKALTYKDPFLAVYKKFLFTPDGRFLLGGMMIGDTSDYVRLVPMVKSQKTLEVPPSQFILGTKKDGDDNADDLDDDTQICSCHNVSKGDVTTAVKQGTCTSLGCLKSCTKAGTGCGGCMPLVTSIFNAQMKAQGSEVLNYLCPHFRYSRADLFQIAQVKRLKTFGAIMAEAGRDKDSLGCEVCKPTLGSILASLWNGHVVGKELQGLQDTNDKFLGNIQRSGTFSVIPRVLGGEILPRHLKLLGEVAERYGLYCKITGGQRIDLLGARKQDLVAIWRELVNGGMESGHAYAKSLRTVKSCVGTNWCRFGVGDSTGMAIKLEERYRGVRSPHKFKGGVSGCVRECAEAQGKDFGLIATEKGWNVFVGGNGGAKPRHAELLAKDVPPDDVVPMLDRYLMFYIRTADKLQRTARWIEGLPGGINYLRDVILNDSLGICASLEKQMQELTGSFFCEWTEVLKNPKLQEAFNQFGNSEKAVENIEPIEERGQIRPADWVVETAQEDFAGKIWKSGLSWQPLIEVEKFEKGGPVGGGRAVLRGGTQLAVFWVPDKSGGKGRWYASQQMCPHKRAFVLSDGLIGDDRVGEEGQTDGNLWVSCPMHKRNFKLDGANGKGSGPEVDTKGQKGKCLNDETLSIATFEAEERDDGWVYVKLPTVEELDEVLGMDKWRVKDGEVEAEKRIKAKDSVRNSRGRKLSPDGKAEVNGNGNGSPKREEGVDW